MPRLYERVARKNHHGIEKGQKYFTWHPKGSPWQYSLEKPDLRDAWTQEIEGFRERIQELKDTHAEYEEEEDERDDVESDLAALEQEIEERKDELQSNLDNMPEQLQDSSILNERIEELDQLIEECSLN
jgi:DNA repair exonuclease SbcCD ATPase subunit